MSTDFLRSAISFCEEVSAGTNASTSTPIGKTITSFQGSSDMSSVSPTSISPISRNANKRPAIDTNNTKLKGKASLSSIPVKKRKQFSPKILSKDVSKKPKKNVPPSSIFAKEINETLNNTLSRESTTTRNMYKQIINNSKESPTLSNNQSEQPVVVLKKHKDIRTDRTIDLKKMFKNNIVKNKQANVKSAKSNVSSEATNSGSANSCQSSKSFSKRKLYSNVSEFTDNENVNVGEKSFLEKKNMVNIYDSSKKLEINHGILQKNSGNKEKETSTKNVNADVYSLRKSRNSKNYFGEDVLEKSIIYKTATKTDTNKYVSNLLNGIINKNLKSGDTQNVENTVEESVSESIFLSQDVDSSTNINVNKKRTNKPKSVPNRKIKQKEIKNIPVKNKTSKKQSNEKKIRKSVSLKEKDSGKKAVEPVKRNTVKQKISDYLKKTNRQSNSSIDNHVVKKYKNAKSKRETNLTREDEVFRHRRSKNTAYNFYGKQNKENDEFDAFSNKFSSKYGAKADKRIRNSNDFQHRNECSSLVEYHHENARLFRGKPKSNEVYPRNASCHCQMPNRKIGQLDRHHSTEILPKYSQHEDAQSYFCLPDDFESFYRRYYPKTDNSRKNSMQVALCPPQSSIPRFDAFKSNGIMDIFNNSNNYRDETVSLANELCENATKRKQITHYKLYTNTKIVTIDNHDDFKLPIGIPKRNKPKAIQSKNNFEYDHHLVNDDVSVASEFSSVSRNGFIGRYREQELPQSAYSNGSKSISVFSKRTPLYTSSSTLSHVDNMSSFDNQLSNNMKTSDFNIVTPILRKRYDTFKTNSHKDNYNKITESHKDLHANGINIPSTNNRYALQKMDDSEAPSRVNRIQSLENELDSPILRKYDQFKKRLKDVSDVDSWRNNFSVVPEPTTSRVRPENDAIALYCSVNDNPSFGHVNASTSKTNVSANPKSDDSWITIERPAIPSSPWRSSGSYQ